MMAESIFCKFCGVSTNAPCVDETDLSNYSRTIDRCSDAALAFEAEQHYEGPALTGKSRGTEA